MKLYYGTTADPDVLFRLQHQISDPFFYIESEAGRRVFLNGLEIEAFTSQHTGDVVAIPTSALAGEAVSEQALEVIGTYGDGSAVEVTERFPLSLADELRSSGVVLEVTNGLAHERLRKTTAEVEAVAANMQVTAGAFARVEEMLSCAVVNDTVLFLDDTELTSEYIKRQLTHYFVDHDMDCPHNMIVSCGVDAAAPHHEGVGVLRAHETIIVDLFPRSLTNFYYADMTRTYVKGQPSETAASMHAAVAASQQAALASLKPGVPYADVYQVSADVIAEHGFDVGDTGYVHSLGHGLGIDLHEAPRLDPNSEGVLQIGEVVTVEPGLYYPEHGGVRIEDTVVITENGYQNLTNYQSDWIIT